MTVVMTPGFYVLLWFGFVVSLLSIALIAAEINGSTKVFRRTALACMVILVLFCARTMYAAPVWFVDPSWSWWDFFTNW